MRQYIRDLIVLVSGIATQYTQSTLEQKRLKGISLLHDLLGDKIFVSLIRHPTDRQEVCR